MQALVRCHDIDGVEVPPVLSAKIRQKPQQMPPIFSLFIRMHLYVIRSGPRLSEPWGLRRMNRHLPMRFPARLPASRSFHVIATWRANCTCGSAPSKPVWGNCPGAEVGSRIYEHDPSNSTFARVWQWRGSDLAQPRLQRQARIPGMPSFGCPHPGTRRMQQ